jgi:hypothetical protein
MYLKTLLTLYQSSDNSNVFVNYKKGALDLQPQVIKFTNCLPMVGGSLGVLWVLPSLKLVTTI